MFRHPTCLLLLITLIWACNPVRVVKPLERGEARIGANIGGAVIKLGSAVTPLPLTSLYAAYGFTGKTTGYAGLHSTALLFGVLQSDLGITHSLVTQNKAIPGISVSPGINLMFDTWEKHFRSYPQVGLNMYWNYGKKQHLVYLLSDQWVELQAKKAHGETQQTHWLPSFGAGHQWNTEKYNWQIEIRYLAPTESNRNLVVKYVSPASTGALGVYFGVSRNF